MTEKNYMTVTKVAPLISVREAAQLLSISRSKVYGLIESKKVPHVRIGGRVLFREDLLESWIRDQVVEVQ